MAVSVDVELRGMEAAKALVQQLGEPWAARLVAAVAKRQGASLRARLVALVRQVAPTVPAGEARRRVLVSASRIRLLGAGKAGRGFVRPRNLGAKVVGGSVQWGPGGAGTSAPRAWIASPVSGSKAPGRGSAGVGRTGRNFANQAVRGSGYARAKAVVFQRDGADRYPIRALRGPYTVGGLVQSRVPGEQLAADLRQRLAAELERVLAVELEKGARR